MPIETVQPDTVLELQSEPLGRLVVTGPRNTLRVGKDVVLNLTFWLQGSGTTIEIEDGCHLTGMIRVVRPATPSVELIAEQPSTLLGLAIDDVRDVLEEDPAALTALADRLAGLLLGGT